MKFISVISQNALPNHQHDDNDVRNGSNGLYKRRDKYSHVFVVTYKAQGPQGS